MAFVRHLKVTLLRAKNINSCTIRKARTMVVAKASYKNLVYTTNRVEDMGQNPAWDNDGTNEFHFDFKDETECITLELFNRNNDCIGVSKLNFTELANLLPGKSELKTLPVIEKQKQSGELVLMTEIKEQQAMGELGLLTVELRKGIIQGITRVIFGSKTTKISATLIYKHTTYTSGILKDVGNKFVWHEDNTFTFIINSNLKADDILKLEVYNSQAKVGECEMLMSLFIEQDENLRADRSESVETELSLGNKPVGNIEVAASFTRSICRRSSFPETQHPSTSHFYPPPHLPTSQYYSTTSQPTQLYPPPPGLYSPPVPQFNPSPSFNLRSPAPSSELYPPGPHLYDIPSTSHDPRRSSTSYLHRESVSDLSNLQSFSPSAPEYQGVLKHHSRGSSDTVLLSQGYQNAHGAPSGREERPLNQAPGSDEELRKFIESFHFT